MSADKTREDYMDWRTILEMIERDAQPAKIAKELPGMIEWSGGDEDGGIQAMLGFQGLFILESAGLAALYVLPPADATTALAAVSERLQHIDFETGMEELPPEQQRLVRKFTAKARPLYTDFARVMETVLGAYARNEYDLTADPNALVLEAERVVASDPQAALNIIGRAGAMGLRGKRWWWRWDAELKHPLAGWVGLAWNLVQDNTDVETPLGPLEEERTRWHRITQEAREQFEAEPPRKRGRKPAGDRFDKLIQRLYKGEHALTDDLEKAIRAQRDEAIPRLIELARDERLWWQDGPGGGWVAIHAVRLLGGLGAGEAVPTLIDVLAGTDPLDILYDAAIQALESIGAPAAPAVLDTARYTRNRELKAESASILGKVGQGHPDTFNTLVALFDELSWDEERMFAAWGLGDLGDARAIPILQNTLRSPDTPNDVRAEIADVLNQLREPHARRAPAPPPQPPSAAGEHLRRTAPCWCGSGKQYRKCHMHQDLKPTRKRKRKQ